MLSPRLLRWCIILGAYNYKIIHKAGKNIINADALSMLPIKTTGSEVPPDHDILMLECPPENKWLRNSNHEEQ